MARAMGSIGQIAVTVEDVPTMVDFYRDVIGLPFLFDVPDQDMAFFDCDGVRLYLSKASSPQFVSRPILSLRVDEIDHVVERLRSHGVTFLADPAMAHEDDRHELWLAFFNDPEGHPLALMEERPR